MIYRDVTANGLRFQMACVVLRHRYIAVASLTVRAELLCIGLRQVKRETEVFGCLVRGVADAVILIAPHLSVI